MSDRLVVKDLLLDAGFPAPWVSTYAAIVSRIYYHDVRQGDGMRKDAQGAVYGQADAAGLLQVARDLKDNPGQASAPPLAAVCRNDGCSMRWTAHGGPCD